MRTHARRLSLIGACSLASAASAASVGCVPAGSGDEHFTEITDALQGSFKRAQVLDLAGSELEDRVRRGEPIPIMIDGELVELDVQPYDLRAPTYRAEDDGSHPASDLGVFTFRGSVRGQGTSDVRINLLPGRIGGFLRLRGREYFLDAVSRYSDTESAADRLFIVERSDVLATTEPTCGVEGHLEQHEGAAPAAGATLGTAAARIIELATEADSAYVAALGGAAQANQEILGVLNVVEGLYSRELDLRVRVVFQHTWSGSDPFSGSTIESLLDSFRGHWNATYPTLTRDAAHLFTARGFALSRGYAFIGTVCANPAAAYALSGYIDWAPGKHLVTAHELGHNLSAQHVGEEVGCAGTLMNTVLSPETALTFCAASRSQIGGFVATSGSCLEPVRTRAPRFDFDGDRKTDVALFRPSDGSWHQLLSASGGYSGAQWGTNGDVPVAADYDADGRADLAVYRGGTWYVLRSSDYAVNIYSWGLPDDLPTPGDFDGDGAADIAVFRPSEGVWYRIDSSTGRWFITQFGVRGDIPLARDYDGDGKDDIAVFRPSEGVWYRIDSATGSFSAAQWGTTEDVPVPADYDGDGRADLAVFRPSTGTWWILRSSDQGYGATHFGVAGDVPVTGDYDGDGRADLTVYRPSAGTWYFLMTTTGFSGFPFGLSTDRSLGTIW